MAPRGYGRGSFRFYEIIQLGAIPIYIWDDIEWLPYKSLIDYSQFAISINIKNLDQLPNMINDIINTGKYKTMIENLEKIINDNVFSLDYMCNYIITNNDSSNI